MWVLTRCGGGAVCVWGSVIPGRRNSMCKGPEESKGDTEQPINRVQDFRVGDAKADEQ